jgi:hypothetical protein
MAATPFLNAYDQPPLEPGFESLFDGKDITQQFVVIGEPGRWWMAS